MVSISRWSESGAHEPHPSSSLQQVVVMGDDGSASVLPPLVSRFVDRFFGVTCLFRVFVVMVVAGVVKKLSCDGRTERPRAARWEDRFNARHNIFFIRPPHTPKTLCRMPIQFRKTTMVF